MYAILGQMGMARCLMLDKELKSLIPPQSRKNSAIRDVPVDAALQPPSRKSWLAKCSSSRRDGRGRPTAFPDAQAVALGCIEYFEWCSDNPVEFDGTTKLRPFTLQGLCMFLGITTATWRNWRKDIRFSAAVERAENILYEQKLSGAMTGFFNASVSMRVLGLAEKTEHSGTIETKPALDPTKLTDEQLEAALSLAGSMDEAAE